jgi:hypothetical protein
MADAIQELITFKFEGGFADQHQLSLYDASRFQYGAARMLYSLEYLREKGQYPERVVPTRVKADFRVTAAEQKCFLQTIYQIGAPILAETVIKAPIDAVMAWIFDKFSRKDEKERNIKELAIRLSEEETKRAEIYAADKKDLYAIIKEMADQNGREKSDLIELLKAQSTLNADLIRQSLLKEHDKELEKIILMPTDQMNFILGKSRKQITDIIYPLKHDAETLSISSTAEDKAVSFFDETDLVYLEGDKRDEKTTDILGLIKNYDRETGLGKWRPANGQKPISFLVRARDRERLKDEILDEMKKDDVMLRFFIVRDASGAPKYLIFEDFLD